MTTEYRVHLDAFEGPLDLLLHLIRRAEVDVHDIPIGTVTDQYIAHLEGIERIDIDLAGEFLVMAATLMEIKSRMLAPAETRERGERESAGDETDPRQELVRQLLEYKKYRDAGEALDERRHEWGRRSPAGPVGIDRDALREASGDELDLEDLGVVDLCEAFARIVEAVDFERVGDHEVVVDDTPIELHAEDIMDRLARDGEAGESGRKRMTLQQVFRGRTRSEMLGLFLAMLELLKEQRLGAKQDEESGLIWIEEGPGPSAFGTGEDGRRG